MATDGQPMKCLECGDMVTQPHACPVATRRLMASMVEAAEDDHRRSRDLAIAAAERARLAHKMRTTYPQNKHAREWADWIEREST